MAVVVAGRRGKNIGKVVTCVRLLERREHTVQDEWGPMWLVDVPQSFTNALGVQSFKPWAPDQALMPINPLDDLRAEELAVADGRA